MYRLERDEFLSYPLIGLWSVLGFQAGFINSFGFLACGRFVSHVTGFGTQIGGALAGHEISLAVELLGFPFFFISGSAFSGALTSARIDRGLKPCYELVAALLPLALFSATLAGAYGVFGKFGADFKSARDFLLLYSLTFMSGMQNGCFATMTKGQIRTTHLTGIATDIGTDLSRLLFGRLDSAEKRLVKRANISRFVTFVSFAIGAILSVMATQMIEYMALLIPAMTATSVAIIVGYIGLITNKSGELRFESMNGRSEEPADIKMNQLVDHLVKAKANPEGLRPHIRPAPHISWARLDSIHDEVKNEIKNP